MRQKNYQLSIREYYEELLMYMELLREKAIFPTEITIFLKWITTEISQNLIPF